MAEVIATVALISSITSLVDVSVRVVSRLRELRCQSSEAPKSLRSLSVRLPLLTNTLKRIRTQANAGSFSDDVKEPLTAAIDNIAQQLSIVEESISKVLPQDGASKPKRVLQALRSIAKEDEMKRALKEIHKTIEALLLHQTTQLVDTGELIRAKLSELSLIADSSTALPKEDEALPLTRTSGRAVFGKLPPCRIQTFTMLHNSNRDLMSRFSLLPIAAQEQFIARQERQLIHLVEKHEVEFLKLFALANGQPRSSRDWGMLNPTSVKWCHQENRNLWFHSRPSGVAQLRITAINIEASGNGTTSKDILAAIAFSSLEESSPTNILCALAGQIAQKSPASMEKAKRFYGRHVSNGQLRTEIQDLQDLIVEMSLSEDIARIFIVIGGIDEAQYEARWRGTEDFMPVIDIPKYARKVRLFVISRREKMMMKTLHICKTKEPHIPCGLRFLMWMSYPEDSRDHEP
ncbi:MAG: hypothetical protein Q9168_007707 [Polycauliona sp. 1 TL-2023]